MCEPHVVAARTKPLKVLQQFANTISTSEISIICTCICQARSVCASEQRQQGVTVSGKLVDEREGKRSKP